MGYALNEKINAKIAKVFGGLGLNERFAFAKNSDRPDLSDFQCNGALALAKEEKKTD